MHCYIALSRSLDWVLSSSAGNYTGRPKSNGKRKAVVQVTRALAINGSLLYVKWSACTA
jgi:hypothetical protein